MLKILLYCKSEGWSTLKSSIDHLLENNFEHEKSKIPLAFPEHRKYIKCSLILCDYNPEGNLRH